MLTLLLWRYNSRALLRARSGGKQGIRQEKLRAWEAGDLGDRMESRMTLQVTLPVLP